MILLSFISTLGAIGIALLGAASPQCTIDFNGWPDAPWKPTIHITVGQAPAIECDYDYAPKGGFRQNNWPTPFYLISLCACPEKGAPMS